VWCVRLLVRFVLGLSMLVKRMCKRREYLWHGDEYHMLYGWFILSDDCVRKNVG
jgi:hypothetical protein